MEKNMELDLLVLFDSKAFYTLLHQMEYCLFQIVLLSIFHFALSFYSITSFIRYNL